MTTTTSPTSPASRPSRDGSVVLDSSDCDTCGTNWDKLTWSYRNGTFDIQLSVACYGHAECITDDVDEAVEFVLALRSRFSNKKAAKLLKAEAKEIAAAAN